MNKSPTIISSFKQIHHFLKQVISEYFAISGSSCGFRHQCTTKYFQHTQCWWPWSICQQTSYLLPYCHLATEGIVALGDTVCVFAKLLTSCIDCTPH